MTFDISAPTRILFGPGRVSEAGAAAGAYGARVLVVLGGHPERAGALIDGLRLNGLWIRTFSVASEPTVDIIRRGVAEARESGCDVVLGAGGGSVLDTGKAVAALMTNPGDPLDYLEVIGAGKPLSNPSVPYIALPTTAGTGTEATQNAVIASPEHGVKVSLRSPMMFPRAAIIDPLLTLSCPPGVTAASGLDALTQLVEPFTCTQPNPMVDALCRDAFGRVRRSLRRACEDGSDGAAREDMALAALFSGIALSNAKLGAVHGIAASLGGMTAAPHGAACGRLLPEVMDVNIRLLREGKGNAGALDRYTEIARLLTSDASASPEDGAEWVRGLMESLKIPGLSGYGLTAGAFAALAGKALKASSMKGNPVPLEVDDIVRILTRAM
jgi:alcohol dehydrogenase class IV